MRVLVLGGSGMLGHKLAQTMATRTETVVAIRQSPTLALQRLFHDARFTRGFRAEDEGAIRETIEKYRPETVVNCIGIVKQRELGTDPATCISVNALFPQLLARACSRIDARLICISTDCVFSGDKGAYRECEVPDARDAYGRTKILGEVIQQNSLTIRSSIIGRELHKSHGLLEWFLSQQGKRVKGFRRAIFSGFTTLALSDVLRRIILKHPDLSGLYHVASEPISKYDLLCMIRDVYGLDIDIEPDDEFMCDRSLNGTRFREATGITAPSWREMIEAMHADPTPYSEIRG